MRERSLYAAVLRQAIEDIQESARRIPLLRKSRRKNRDAAIREAVGYARDAQAWILRVWSDEDLFSFGQCCEVLDIDPGKMLLELNRQGLLGKIVA